MSSRVDLLTRFSPFFPDVVLIFQASREFVGNQEPSYSAFEQPFNLPKYITSCSVISGIPASSGSVIGCVVRLGSSINFVG